MNIRDSILALNNQVSKILKTGQFSQTAIKSACDKVAAFADTLEQQMAKRGLLAGQQDDDPLGLHVSTSGDAVGVDTSTNSQVKAAVVDYGNVTIALATAQSLSVSSDGAQMTSAATFSAVTGSDLTIAKTYNKSGTNWSASAEVVFSVDFKFLTDLNLCLDRETNIVTGSTMDLASGNVATADFDVMAQAEDTSVETIASVLTIEDTLSFSFVGSDLYIA